MAGPLDFLNDPKNDPSLNSMGADIPAQLQGQLLLEALARVLPPGGGNTREQGEAKAREARVKGQARPGGKDLDVGQLIAQLIASTSTEGPESIGRDYRAGTIIPGMRPGYDEEQAEQAAYRKP